MARVTLGVRHQALHVGRAAAGSASDQGWRPADPDGHDPTCGEAGQLKTAQCRKWRWPVNTMAMPCSSAAAMTSSSRTEPPGWITAGDPGRGSGVEAVAEREERVARTGPAGGTARRSFGGDAGRVESVLLAGADAERLEVLGVDDGVAADGGTDLPRELEVAPLVVARRRRRDDPPCVGASGDRVGLLHEQSAVDRADVEGQCRCGVGRHHPQVLLRGEEFERVGFEAGCDHDLGEHVADRCGHLRR